MILGSCLGETIFMNFAYLHYHKKNPRSNTTHSDLVNSVKISTVIMKKENISYDLRLAICLIRLHFLIDTNPESS